MKPPILRRVLAALTAVLAVIAGLALTPAQTALAAGNRVSITKSPSVASASLGQGFSYALDIQCTDFVADCSNTVVTDVVPAAFPVDSGVAVVSSDASTVRVTGQTVTVTFAKLTAGNTGTITIPAHVDPALPHSADGVPVTNTATIAADASNPDSDSADVAPIVPLNLAAGLTKDITPATALKHPGTRTVVTLDGKNASNGAVDSLTITDPSDPATSNAFTHLSPTGQATIAQMPAGADEVRMDYLIGSAWTLGAETPLAGPGPGTVSGPASVTDFTTVKGVRLVFDNSSGGTLPVSALAKAQIPLDQNSTVAGLSSDFTVDDVAAAVVTAGGTDSAPATASDAYLIGAGDLAVSATKVFAPSTVTVGGTTVMTLGGTNSSDKTVNRLILADRATAGVTDLPAGSGNVSMFADGVTVTGWASGVRWPAGATQADITFEYAPVGGGDNYTSGPIFTSTANTLPGIPAPATVGDKVVGFDVGFTGAMAPGATATVAADLTTPADGGSHVDADSGTQGVQWPNVVQVTSQVTDPASPYQGYQGGAQQQASLTTYSPQLHVNTVKSITPSQALGVAGNDVIVQLQTQVAPYPPTPADLPTSSTIGATQIVIQDPAGAGDPTGFDEWWNVFNASAIVQTAVPTNAQLVVEYWDTTGTPAWKPLTTSGPGTILNYSIPTAIRRTIGGLRFTYTADAGTTFAPGGIVEPNFSAALRAGVASTTTYHNAFSATASNGTVTSPRSDSTAKSVTVIPTTGGDGQGELISKEFKTVSGSATVTARSQNQIDAGLHWSTGGYQRLTSMVIQDEAAPPTNSTQLAQSMWDAFDLVKVKPITPAMDPLLAYDEVTEVDLWDGSGWTKASQDPCPCDGSFPGFSLTTAEQASTEGVRLVFAESPTRGNRIGTDPTRPQVGTGVASSIGDNREILLTLQLRDFRRSDATAVLGTTLGTVYNTSDTGAVNDIARATGLDGATQVATDTGSDQVTVLDVPLNVTVAKTWQGGPIGVPPSSVPQAHWPSGRATVTATNTTAAKVDTLVVQDPVGVTSGDGTTCAGANSTHPLEYFNIRSVDSVSVPSGASSVLITLTGATPSTYSGSGGSGMASTIATVRALPESALVDVTGLSVEFGGRIAKNAASTVVYDTRLRETTRTAGTLVTAGTIICNVAQATVADVGGNVTTAKPTAKSAATIELRRVGIGLTVGKSFSPGQTVEPATGPVTVAVTGQPACHKTAGVCDGFSRATTMSLTDDAPLFWNQYDFGGLSTITLGTPADRVQIDALVGGTFALDGSGTPVLGGAHWVTGSPTTAAAAALPSGVTAAQVQGLRFTFLTSDGAVWENPQYPLEKATFTVARRATLHVGDGGSSTETVPSDLPGNRPAPGETVAGIATNTVDGFVQGADTIDLGSGPVPVTATASTDATVLYRHAINAVTIDKKVEGSHLTSLPPGSLVHYSVAVTNSGSVPIVDPVVTDDLPLDGFGGTLMFDPNADPTDPGSYSYALSGAAPSPASGPALPTDAAQVAVATTPNSTNGDLQQLTFRFPAGSVLEVGQAYTITLVLAMRPGLPEATYTNTAGVTGLRPWDKCNGTTRSPATFVSCQNTAQLTVTGAAALRSHKYVKAGPGTDLGAFSTQSGVACAPVSSGTAAGFYDAPCVPRTAPGQSEIWRMTFTNTGNRDQNKVVAYDRLPQPDDTGAINLASRGSQWRPVLTGVPALVGAPAGSTLTTEYLTDSTPGCTGNLITACASGWTPLTGAESTAVFAGIRALRFTVTFAAAHYYRGADEFAVDLTTTTPAYAPTLTTDAIAYNTIAAQGYPTSGGTTPAAEGLRVGVALASGDVEIEKDVTGAQRGVAPSSFDLTLGCTSLGAPVPLGAVAALTVTAGAVQTVRDLPYGSSCTVVENEAAALPTRFSATTVSVGSTADPVVRIVATNEYDTASLVIDKRIDSPATDQSGAPVGYGPFDFSVVCTFRGAPVAAVGHSLDSSGAMSVTLGTIGSVTAASEASTTLTGLPARADCEVTETGPAGADGETGTATVHGAVAAPVTNGPVDLTLAADTSTGSADNTVVVANHYSVGALEIDKQVTGDAASSGTGPFQVAVVCAVNGTTVWNGTVTLGGGRPLSATIPDIAAGAQCTVAETDAGGATATTITTSPVAIAAGTTAVVSIVNRFDPGHPAPVAGNAGGTPGTGTGTGTMGGLPQTGQDFPWWIAASGLGLAALGTFLVIVGRRRPYRSRHRLP